MLNVKLLQRGIDVAMYEHGSLTDFSFIMYNLFSDDLISKMISRAEHVV